MTFYTNECTVTLAYAKNTNEETKKKKKIIILETVQIISETILETVHTFAFKSQQSSNGRIAKVSQPFVRWSERGMIRRNKFEAGDFETRPNSITIEGPVGVTAHMETQLVAHKQFRMVDVRHLPRSPLAYIRDTGAHPWLPTPPDDPGGVKLTLSRAASSYGVTLVLVPPRNCTPPQLLASEIPGSSRSLSHIHPVKPIQNDWKLIHGVSNGVLSYIRALCSTFILQPTTVNRVVTGTMEQFRRDRSTAVPRASYNYLEIEKANFLRRTLHDCWNVASFLTRHKSFVYDRACRYCKEG